MNTSLFTQKMLRNRFADAVGIAAPTRSAPVNI